MFVGRLLFIIAIAHFFLGLNEGAAQSRSPRSLKQQRIKAVQNKNKPRQRHLILQLVKSSRTRYHSISALVKSMPKETKESFKGLASSRRIDLRSPFKVSSIQGLSFSLGRNKYKFQWNPKAKAYFYNKQKVFYDRSQSAKYNFKALKKILGQPSVALSDLLWSRAFAQNLDQVVFDLNYLLYVRSVTNEQQLINELGSDYLLKAEEKMVRLVQNNKFLRMDCSMGAHSMEARIVLGDGSPQSQVTLIAGDYGRGQIEQSIQRDGKIEKLTSLSARSSSLLSQNIFNEVCMNMTGPAIQEFSDGLWFYGGQGSSQ